MTKSTMPVQVERELDRYLAVISPRRGDPTFSVLKAHLLFEELLNDFVSAKLHHPNALRDARLTFAQILALAVSLNQSFRPEDPHWEALRRLNALRNKMAHSAVVDDLKERSDALAEFIFQIPGMPKRPPPEGDYRVVLGEPSAAVFTALDIALAGLHAWLLGAFKLFNRNVGK